MVPNNCENIEHSHTNATQTQLLITAPLMAKLRKQSHYIFNCFRNSGSAQSLIKRKWGVDE